ncbi:MAG: diguanylate cyclase [Actinomycetota bacterium]
MSKEKYIKLFATIASFILITFLIIFTRRIILLWQFYYIPLLLAALAFDSLGGVLVAIFSGLFCILYAYFSLPLRAVREITFMIVPGSALMLLVGIIVGRLQRSREEQQQKMDRLTMEDRLTGVYNYSYLMDRIEEERNRADRFGSKLSLIIIDIDLFKKFNDRFGHAKGNLLLKKLAKIIEEQVRTIDIVARYGGEEFAILLPNTGKAASQVIAERIRTAVESATFEGGGEEPQVRMTISAGVATYPDHACDQLELIDKADRALLFAKDGGRNCIRLYSPEMDALSTDRPAYRTDRQAK